MQFIRHFAAVLSVVILCSCLLSSTALAQEITYPDIKPGAWYKDAVQYVSDMGFMTGYQNGKFGPSDKLQRQDFIVTLARVGDADLNKYADRTGGLFDVKRGSYFAPSIAWAINNRVATGYQNNKFGVGDAITREQVCTLLWRYLGSPSVSNTTAALRAYPDYADVSAFAKDAVAWALNNNVISGMSDGRLAPLENASRAQIATILMRMDQQDLFVPFKETTNGASDWAMKYYNYIIDNVYDTGADAMIDYLQYDLVFINDDAVPEIWVDYAVWAAGTRMISYYNNKVTSESFSYSGLTYVPRKNRFLLSGGKMGYYYDTVYKLHEGLPYTLGRGTYEEVIENGRFEGYRYTWNGASVGPIRYEENIDKTLGNPSNVKIGGKSYDYYGILNYLASV